MDFISRFIKKRIANLIGKFHTSKIVEQYENDYPLDGRGDHYRFFI